MASPVPDRPGLLIRDPYHYSDAMLIVPPPLVACLEYFDGTHSEIDLRKALVEATGDLRVGDLLEHLRRALSEAGFVEDETYARLKEQRHADFRNSPRRDPAHAGSAYPAAGPELNSVLLQYLDGAGANAAQGDLLGIAAPHVSPEGGWESYRAAYAALGPEYQDRTFVILGTSHYGEPERFGLTRKPFFTPLGEARTNRAIVDRLAEGGGPAVKLEDYCHAVEHSIEFQVIFLQQLYGPEVEIVPVLCGPFARAIHEGGRPEDSEDVRRFLDALGETAAREGRRLFWVLGVDMAHMGRRYGDPFSAVADRDRMEAVGQLDRTRIERICAADGAGFWSAVQEDRDPLKWCGSAPFYSFLQAVPQARGRLLRYEQWNIDPESVVSFGAVAFAGDV